MKTNQFPQLSRSAHRWRRGCRHLKVGCLLLFIFTLVAICGLLTFLFSPQKVDAHSLNSPLTVWMLIDNSNSMFEKDGIGSDPDLLRLDAARLFLSYLGVDDRSAQYQAGVIFFGSEAETAVPLTPLTNEEQRADLFAQIAHPPRQGWTDHLAALDMAQAQINALPATHRTAIVLLTDGKPEWDDAPTEAEQTAYLTALQTRSEVLANRGTSLFIILLANAVTDNDPEIANRWQPLWQEMSAAIPSGAYFVARDAADLPGIYHDIVALLTGNVSEGIVYEAAVPPDGAETTITIPEYLAQLTLVISKEDPTQTIQLTTADGRSLTEADPTVRQAGGSGRTHEEIWVIEQPPAGKWTIRVEGAGEIVIWQDGKPTPAQVVTASPSSTTAATAVPVPAKAAAVATTMPVSTPTPPALSHTVTAAVSNPTAIIEVLPMETKSYSWLWAVGAGSVLLASISGLLLVHQASQRPHLTGALRLLHGNRTADGQAIIELDTFRTGFLRLGYPPADVPLPEAKAQVVFSLGHSLGDATEILVRRSGGSPLLDGDPLTQETRLQDTAVLDLGGVQLRYENLRLRQAQREQAQLLDSQYV